jgi:hypothetical protein
MLKAFAFSRIAAEKLLRFVQDIAASPELSTNGAVPRWKTDGLIVQEIIHRSEDVLLRRGLWCGAPVLAEQYSAEKFKYTASVILQIRFSLRHPMVFSPLAVLHDDGADAAYVVSAMPSGPLPRKLRSKTFSDSELRQCCRSVARCVAAALSFIHTAGYVHCDLAAQNVMEAEPGSYQLAITSRCRKADADGGTEALGLAIRWVSPDALFTGRYLKQDDIYGFGVLIWEVMSRCTEAPFCRLVQHEVSSALAHGERLDRPTPCVDNELWDHVVVPCFASRMRRPSAEELIGTIDRLAA